MMHGIYVIYINVKNNTRYKHRFGENPVYVNHLKISREAGNVHINTDRTPTIPD